MTVRDLPHLNAILNAASAICLLTGYYFIRRRNIEAHRRAMLAACSVSVLFLVSYVIYHWQVGSVRFSKTGTIRTVYLTILLTHTTLAIANVPFVITILRRALRRDFERHRRLARYVFPVWLYVSVTGVIVYWMLYRM